jgi:C4-dicarboxylate-specific signal transduction histidine kinase
MLYTAAQSEKEEDEDEEKPLMASTTGAMIKVSVEDSGIGLSADARQNLFKVYTCFTNRLDIKTYLHLYFYCHALL